MDNSIYELKNERILDEKLEALFSRWNELLVEKLGLNKNEIKSQFVKDGFYPYYTKQNCKVLFIGREALGMEWAAEKGYTKTLLDCYKNEGEVGGISINKYKFHALLFYITYLLQNPDLKYSEIDYASTIATDLFAKKGGISFAFMNLSKFSNESKNSWQLDKSLFDLFVDNSVDAKGEKFIAEEIKLLDPDLIITMNISDKFEVIGNTTLIDDKTSEDAFLYEWMYTKKSKTIPLIDMWHFSAPSKAIEKKYIEPLFKILETNKILIMK